MCLHILLNATMVCRLKCVQCERDCKSAKIGAFDIKQRQIENGAIV